ncbi:MAG: CotH kinase family protein [Ruminococcus sp.]|nr:CotH kinase family protein [Ruminococcus sp.]
MKYRYHIITAMMLLTAALTSCSGNRTESIPTTVGSETTSEETVQYPETESFESEGILFSARSGFYDSDIALFLSADDGRNIYYTLDGSMPTADSTAYTEPIIITDRSSEPDVLAAHSDIAQPADSSRDWLPQKPVDKATVVRAVAVSPDGTVSPAVSATYFIGFEDKADYYKDMTIISLMTDEEGLFDYDKGIYVLGKAYDDWKSGSEYDPETPYYFMPANFTQKGRDWERPATIQFFRNGVAELTQDVGIRIHGGATRSYPQKSFNIYARSDYGLPKLDYDLFRGNVISESDKCPVTEFDTFMLRNGGNDAMYTRFRDKLVQRLAAGHDFLTQGTEPCIVFIDGEYWGHYEITEKIDDAYVSAHCGVPKKDVCIVKKEELDEGSEETFAEWQELRDWVAAADLSDDAEYEKLCGLVDMQSFMEYVSAEIYINNKNWDSSNMAMWKAQTTDDSNNFADGRWRFIMFDVDYSTGIYGEALPNTDSFERLLNKECFLSDLLKAALHNETFRGEFSKTFMEIADNDFSAERANAETDRLSEEYKDMTKDTYNRFWSGWFRDGADEENYNEAVEMLRNFYNKRYEYIVKYLEEFLAEYSNT